MKIPTSHRRNQGLTLLETLVVAFSLVVIIAFILPAFSRAHVKGGINCTNNLNQIGLAFLIWKGDHTDYPTKVPAEFGGAMETVQSGNPMSVFEVMSNEIGTPKILVCQQDRDCHPATNVYCPFTAKNLSYFVNADGTSTNPSGILCGDDNLQINGTRISSGISSISSNSPIGWTDSRHRLVGNILFADGSAQSLDSTKLTQYLLSTNAATPFRLAIP